MKILLLLAFVVVGALAASLEQNDDELIQIELEQKHLGLDALKVRQAKKLAKLGKSARALPKYHHQKLLDVPFKNDYITASVNLGNQGPYNVAFSTGQTRLWVVGTKVSAGVPTNHNYYDPSKSTTSTNMNKNFADIDSTVSINGNWYTDTFQYGKAKIKNQAFGVADTVSVTDDLVFPVDGVFGINHLSSSAYSQNGEPVAPIDNLLHPLIKKTVTVFLDKLVPPSQGMAKGSITLGGFDKAHCDGSQSNTIDLTYLGDYRFVSPEYGVQYSTYQSYSNYYVYFDSGVSTLQLPTEDLSGIYDLMLPDYDWDTGMYTVDCSSISSLSAISINIDNNYIVINPQQYVVDLDLDGGACAVALGAVDPNNYSKENLVLGTPLFRQYCVSFNFDSQQMVFYKHSS
jgi:cathepsin D